MEKDTASAREALLTEINTDIPAGVDWKQGAIDYLRKLIHSEGSHNELYHLIKPFLGGPDFQPFFSEMYGFLNMLEKARLPMKESVLDVACGPGWTSHFLAKLGYSVHGIDISDDLLDLARRRIAGDPFSVYEGVPLQVRFSVHDIEASPMESVGPFGAAFFESALHHFLDPVQALRNVAPSLKESGILCIWEAAAPRRGTDPYLQNIELMRKYGTLERPYTREQIIQVLKLAGFPFFEFFSQVNGFFNVADAGDRRRLEEQIHSGQNWNIAIASRTESFFLANARQAALLRGDSVAPYSLPVFPWRGGEFAGRDLLRENLRYLKRHVTGIVNRLRRTRRLRMEGAIHSAYRELLDRAPDATGLAHYVGELEQGKSLKDVRKALMASDEYRNRSRQGQ